MTMKTKKHINRLNNSKIMRSKSFEYKTKLIGSIPNHSNIMNAEVVVLALCYLYQYYMPQVEIKDFNALIDNKPFFDQPVKNRQKACEKNSHWYRFIKTNKYEYFSAN